MFNLLSNVYISAASAYIQLLIIPYLLKVSGSVVCLCVLCAREELEGGAHSCENNQSHRSYLGRYVGQDVCLVVCLLTQAGGFGA